MNRTFSRFFRSSLLVSAVALAAAGHAQINDPAGDFLGTFIGPNNADVDVISSNVVYDGSNFFLTATMAGNLNQTAGAIYVWGFDRGQGTARFPTLASNVLFDSVVILRPDTTVTVNRIVGGGMTSLPIGTANISGATISATIDASTLPLLSPGFASQSQYTWNLWPRVGTGNNNQISDFAPDNSNIGVAVAPEGGSLLLIAAGAGVLGMVVRRRRA